jgi:hypothetical protein
MQKEETWAYQSETALLMPHVGSMVTEFFPEDFLVQLYYKIKKDDSLRRTLPVVSKHSLANFVSYFYNKSILACVAKPGGLAGFVWIYDTEGNDKFKRASVGVCFFKEFWGNPVIYELGRLALDWMFKELNLCMILGTIASWNRASVRFGKAMGFEYCGTVPMFFLKEDSATSMDMLSLSRDRFYKEDNG